MCTFFSLKSIAGRTEIIHAHCSYIDKKECHKQRLQIIIDDSHGESYRIVSMRFHQSKFYYRFLCSISGIIFNFRRRLLRGVWPIFTSDSSKILLSDHFSIIHTKRLDLNITFLKSLTITSTSLCRISTC